MTDRDAQLLEQWNSTDVRELLAKWLERTRMNQLQHYEAAKHFDNARLALGIPAVILSTFVGTAVFAALKKEVGFEVQLIVGVISVAAAILASLQTFLRFAERAEKHRSAAASYAAIRHGIELLTHEPVTLRGAMKESLGSIRSQIDALAHSSPNVPESVWKRVQSQKNTAYFGSAGGGMGTGMSVGSAGTNGAPAPSPGREPYDI